MRHLGRGDCIYCAFVDLERSFERCLSSSVGLGGGRSWCVGVSQWWQGVVAGCPQWWRCVLGLSVVGALYGGGDRLQ